MSECYPSLARFVDVNRCWDFDKFVKDMASPGLRDVSKMMMVQLQYRDGTVYMKTKPRMATDVKVPWSEERPFYPDPDRPCPRPRDDEVPLYAPYKKVSGWKKVVRDVRNWCLGGGTVRPSPRDKHEMLLNLQEWGERPHRTLNDDPPTFPSFLGMRPLPQPHQPVGHQPPQPVGHQPHQPVGPQPPQPVGPQPPQPVRLRPQCRCGSHTHQRTNHRDCPLNPHTRRGRAGRGRSRRRHRSRSRSRRRHRSRDRSRRGGRRRRHRSQSPTTSPSTSPSTPSTTRPTTRSTIPRPTTTTTSTTHTTRPTTRSTTSRPTTTTTSTTHTVRPTTRTTTSRPTISPSPITRSDTDTPSDPQSVPSPNSQHTDSDEHSVDSNGVHDLDLIGTKIRKLFSTGWFDGEVIGVSGPGVFKVKYTDGDVEELDRVELYKHELAYEQHYLFY